MKEPKMGQMISFQRPDGELPVQRDFWYWNERPAGAIRQFAGIWGHRANRFRHGHVYRHRDCDLHRHFHTNSPSDFNFYNHLHQYGDINSNE